MGSLSQDAYRLLYDRTPIWLAHLNTVTDSTAHRQGVSTSWEQSSLDSSSPPALCDEPGTTLEPSALTTIGSWQYPRRSPESHADRSAQSASPSASRKRTRSESPDPSPRSIKYRAQSALEVVYDANAQELLADIVKDVSKAVYAIKKASPHTELEHMSKRLRDASDAVEDAAFQILRDGDCRSLALSASVIFQDLFNISFKEVMYDLINRSESTSKAQTEPAQTQHLVAAFDNPIPTIETTKIPPPQAVQVISIDAEALDVDDEIDDDDDAEFILPPLRLTSRLTPR